MPRIERVPAMTTQAGDGEVQVELVIALRPRRPRAGRDASTEPSLLKAESPPRIPRVTRLMALAIKFGGMVDRGEVRDYADLARLGYVTRARLTQIMNLLLLAPDLQEQLLFSATTIEGVYEAWPSSWNGGSRGNALRLH
jgi:hypothetical protein